MSFRLHLTLLLVCAALLSPSPHAHAKGPDLNAQGFKAYQKGDYKKAHALFEKALKKEPSNAYARLNRARTTAVLNKGKEPEDACEYESNWMYRVLADLSKAVELNAAAILPKIDEDEAGLKAFKELEVFQKWRRAVRALSTEPGMLEKLLREGAEWISPQPGGLAMSTFIHLKADKTVMTSHAPDFEEQRMGRWTLKDPRVELVSEEGGSTVWTVKVERIFFNEGRDFFFELQLVPSAPASKPEWMQGPLKAGPFTDDC